MREISLPALAAEIGQAAIAKALSVSPAAINKAISANRQIIVTIHDDGSYTAQELRPFPSQKCTTAEQSGVQSEASEAGTDSMSRRPV